MSRSWTARWDRLRRDLTLADLLLEVTGKALAALGAGALLARWVLPYAWGLIAAGLALSVMVKAKYWRRFWGGRSDGG